MLEKKEPKEETSSTSDPKRVKKPSNNRSKMTPWTDSGSAQFGGKSGSVFGTILDNFIDVFSSDN